jgi:hypothetical protein
MIKEIQSHLPKMASYRVEDWQTGAQPFAKAKSPPMTKTVGEGYAIMGLWRGTDTKG